MSKKIGILTGGGDAPGLNAVISTLVKAGIRQYGYEFIGYKMGYRGLYRNEFIKLDEAAVSGIMHRGGTMLQSSNKDNLFDYTVIENGVAVKKGDVSGVAVENLRKEGVDVLCILGGDGTLTSARDYARLGVNVVGVPKTIDNDLGATEATFGFDTAVDIVTENLGRVHTTAESHNRVIIVEVMGRGAGWIALYSGIAGSADVILLPEIPYSVEKVAEKVRQRDAEGKLFAIIVIGEGAKSVGGELSVSKVVVDSPDPVRFGGAAAKLAAELELLVDHEVRSVQLGHIQRGGEPSAGDRVLSVRYGYKALELIEAGEFGRMVSLKNGEMSSVSLEDVIGSNKLVSPDDELVRAAKALGIVFGD